MGLFQKPVMAGLTRYPMKTDIDCQGIAGLRYTTPAMISTFDTASLNILIE